MSETIVMPKLGLTMESGVIIRWNKNEGDQVRKGDVLLEVESDKSSVEVESEYEGVLLKKYRGESDEVPCGEPIAFIGEAGEAVPEIPGSPNQVSARKIEIKNAAVEQPEQKVEQKNRRGRIISSPRAKRYAKQHNVEITEQITGSGTGGRIEERDVRDFLEAGKASGIGKMSPLARKVAEKRNIDLSGVSGTGPSGRVMKDDVLTAAASKQMEAPVSNEPVKVNLSRMRQIIAQRLSEAKANVPHFYLKSQVNMEEVIKVRKMYNSGNPEKRASLNAILMRLISSVLPKHPYLNAAWNGDSILLYPNVDIGLAVATETGLVTPVVRNCEARNIPQIEEELRVLIDKARRGKLAPEEYTNPTFTVSNLGMYGIDDFTAIINPPAAVILAIGAVKETPVGLNGEIVLKPMMNVTLSGDHRVVDGAIAAAFLKELKSVIETPALGYF